VIRFYYIVEVFDTIEQFIEFVLIKLQLNKGNIKKIKKLCLLFIVCFQLIHVLGCIWIFIAKTKDCSWIEQGNDNIIPWIPFEGDPATVEELVDFGYTVIEEHEDKGYESE